MTQLHEILAIEGDLEATNKKIINEAINTFSKKPEHFQEHHRDLKMFDENRAQENVVERKDMVTSVAEKLSYVRDTAIRYLKIFATKEATNQVARADLRVEGETIAEQVPATVLLGLESRLKHLRGMYEAIPTLQPGIRWEQEATRENVYVQADPERRFKTEKALQTKVAYEATKEHPAQVEKWFSDEPVGEITLRHWSGMLSPAEKSRLLRRLDDLIRGVKRARQRANTAETVDLDLGSRLFDYIHG